MRKIVLFAAILAILGAYGCNEDNVYLPDVNTDGRVIGSVNGVVFDGASHDALAGVQVNTAIRGQHVSTVSDAAGHYAFTNMDPGTYVLTFIFPESVGKDVKSAYTSVKGEVDIPTLDDLYAIDPDLPHDRDFHYEAEGDVEMFPLDGSAEGYVYVQTNMQTMVSADGVNMVADFLYPTDNTNDLSELEILDEEWFTTTDEDGHYMFTGLPTGTMGTCRTQHYMYGDMAFDPIDDDLDMRGGGNVLVDALVFDATTNVDIVSQNWNSNIPFPVGGSFVATFSVPMDPSTFTATLYEYSKALVPITVTWSGNTVTIDPVNDMRADEDYNLTMAGWSTDGQPFTYHSYSIYTGENIPPSIVDTNFEGSETFPVDGNLVFTFNMAMDPSTVIVWWYEDKLGDIVFDKSWNGDNTVLTVDPDVDLDYDYYYQVRVEGKSASGEDLATTSYKYFSTVQLQNVIVTDTNFMADFDNTADLWFNFSEPMEPTGFEISLSDGGQIAFADPVWSNGNTTVTIDPYLDLDKGVNYTVTLDGMAASTKDFYYNKTYRTDIGDDPFIVQTNIVDGEFPIDGNIEVQFNKAMDSETVEVTFNGSGPNPLFGVITWTDSMNMVFNPDAQLLPSQGYSFNVQGDSQDGGSINTTINFDTIGGISAEWNNIMQQDGGYTDFPVDGAIQFRFTLPANLDAPGTSIVLYRNFPAPVEVLVHSALSDGNYLLTITPDQTLELDTEYRIAYTVGSDLLNDTTSGSITFHTEVTPPAPVAVVTNFALDATWDGNYDETSVLFTWDRDANASAYYIYARNPSAAKDDFLRVLTVPQQATDEVTATVNLAATAVFQQYFDTRSTDTPQTPFDGRSVIFKITAVNTLGEGTDSAEFSVSDVYAPSGAFAGQDVSADDTATADGDDAVVVVTFAADEYIDHTVTPVVTITENDLAVNNWGDPLYTPTLGEITFTDQDGYTDINVEIIVADGMNGAGDYVAIDGFQDTSGNAVDVVETPIAAYQLEDTTAPIGTFADPATSSDNTTGVAAVDFTMVFTATELLDETVVPTVQVQNNGYPSAVLYLGTYAYSTVAGVTVVTLDMQLPIGANAVDDVVAISGLTDLVGNVQAAAIGADPLVDTTAPDGDWAQSASADNGAGGADVTITVRFTASELLDDTVAPTFTVTDGGYAGLAVGADNVVFTDGGITTTVDFDLTIPAGANAMDDVVSVNGLTDISGNAQTVAITWDLTDTTAPAAPVNLVLVPSTDSPASVSLDWDDNTEADLAGYNVGRATVSGGPYTQLNGSLLATSDYVDNDAALVNGTPYFYVVTAVDLVTGTPNESVPSAEGTATPADVTAPATPTGLVASGGVDSPATVTLDWADNTEADLQGYRVYRSTTNNFATAAVIGYSGVSSYPDNDPALVLGTNYFYWVVALDSETIPNESSESSVSSAAPVDATAPAVPTGLAAVVGGAAGEADLTWDLHPDTAGDLAGFQISIYDDDGTGLAPGALFGTQNVPGAASVAATVTGLTTGNVYWFTILAEDGVPNASAESSPAEGPVTAP